MTSPSGISNASLGRNQARDLINAISGSSGSPVFWTQLEDRISETKTRLLREREADHPLALWYPYYLGNLIGALEERDEGIQRNGMAVFEYLEEMNSIISEVTILENSVALAPKDEFGIAYREVLNEHIDKLKARLIELIKKN